MATGTARRSLGRSQAFWLETSGRHWYSRNIWEQFWRIGTSKCERKLKLYIFAVTPAHNMISIHHRKFNDVPYIGYYKLLKPAIVARDAELVKNVMIGDFASFQDNDHKLSKKSDPLMGQNPFFLSGDEWQAERKNFSPAFSPAKVWSCVSFIWTRLIIGVSIWLGQIAIFNDARNLCKTSQLYKDTFSNGWCRSGRCKNASKICVDSLHLMHTHFWQLAILYTIENVVKCGFSLEANCLQRDERSIFMKARDALFKTTSLGILKLFLIPVLPQWFVEYLSVP